MNKRNKKKTILLIACEIICLIVMAMSLIVMQNQLSIDHYKNEMEIENNDLKQTLDEAKKEEQNTITTFDEIYKSKAESISFMSKYNSDFEITNQKMKEYKDLLEVDNILIIDKVGNILASAEETFVDFHSSRFNQLKETFNTNEPSNPFEVSTGNQWYRYYGSKLDDNYMVVIEQHPKELYQLLNDTTSQEAVLKNVTVGLDGYVFALSAKNYLIEYHPNESLIGKDALDYGIDVESLENNNYTWLNINGESIYSSILLEDDSYYISAIPQSEIEASRNITVGVILFIFFAVMSIVILYGVFITKENEYREENIEDFKIIGKFRYNRQLGKKSILLSLVGLLCISLISFYMQTLFSLSRQSISNDEKVLQVENTIEIYKTQEDLLTQQYNERYLNKAQIVAYIIENNPELSNDEILDELADVLQIQFISVFNEKGEIIATNSPFTNFTLSEDPNEQSYEFRRLLIGTETFIQKPQADEASGEFRQYIGVGIRDNEKDVAGFVQIGIRPERLENLLKNMDIKNILDGIKKGGSGFSFAISKTDSNFAYYPDEKLIGKDALSYGIQENQLKGGYSDYISIDDKQYFASSLETDEYYVYVAIDKNDMMTERIPLTVVATSISAIAMFIIFVVLSFSKNSESLEMAKEDNRDMSRVIDVEMPDGRIRRTETAQSRWMNISIDWDDKTSEQRIFLIIKWIFGFIAFITCLSMIWKDSIFGENSIFNYIMSGKWEKGINIFALTGCVLVVCIISTISSLIRKLLSVLAHTFAARGETICRMLNSFIKYISILAMLYYCLALIGVDTATLLASAGIISIAISFGAKELVTDILCGLFIIFEGEFRVGDIIMIDDWRGTVIEIGIRTTKVEDGATNVKIIRNSNVSNVINMTKQYSFAMCDVGIEYGESLERVESILMKEFANIKANLPAIKDGPFYRGVSELADSSVTIRIAAQCHERDRAQLERDLKRQMKLIFDKYDISIPFPQIVINQPTDFKEATHQEKRQAAEFTNEQRALGKSIGNEEEENK